jgi:hypothetical protein
MAGPPNPQSTQTVTLESITEDTLGNVSDTPDHSTESELKHWQAEAAHAEAAAAFTNIDERKKYAAHIFWLVAGWLGLMGYILLCQGYDADWFELHDTVLIALITTTTGGVVGLLVLVVKYLFNPRQT